MAGIPVERWSGVPILGGEKPSSLRHTLWARGWRLESPLLRMLPWLLSRVGGLRRVPAASEKAGAEGAGREE